MARSQSLIPALADAIQRQEGWFSGSVVYKANNPGNIMDYDYYKKTGQFRVQQYGSYEEGRAALESLIGKYISQGLTLEEFFAKYAPSGHGGNNPNTYANNVAGWIGIDTSTPLNQIDYQGQIASNPGQGSSTGSDSSGSGGWEPSGVETPSTGDSQESLIDLQDSQGLGLNGTDGAAIVAVILGIVGLYVAFK